MSVLSRVAASFGAVIVLFVSHASAQPSDPIDLARGLRENGSADLAIEYLLDLAKKNPNPGTLSVIPLERARAKLELASGESDDRKRTALVTEAKADFDKFLASNATHPRRAEAALSLARLISVQAKGMVSKANKLTDDNARKTELLRARPVFQDAATRFGQAATEFGKQRGEVGLTPARLKQIDTELYQAQLDQAINLFELAFTFLRTDAKEAIERGATVKAAKELFKKLSGEDQTHPLCWVARAWVGECDRENTSLVDAQKTFDEVKQAATRMPTIAATGARTARFFELRGEYQKAFGEPNKAAAFRKAQGLIEQWLAEPQPRGTKPTPEVYAARYYLAKSKEQQARTFIKIDPMTMQPVLQGSARELLQGAEREYRRILEPENDYSSRATEDRTQVIRLLIGDPDKIVASQVNDFETGMMTAQVQLYKAVRTETEGERKSTAQKAVILYERIGQLPIPKDLSRDAADAQVNLVYAYILADRPYQAAILGEHLAKTTRAPAMASRAGLYAMQAYRQAAGKLDAQESQDRKSDLDRATKIGLMLDKQFPQDPNTDAARLQVAQQYLQSGRLLEAFDISARVGAGSTRAINARYLQSIAAYEILRPSNANEDGKPSLTAAQKTAVSKRILADLSNVPDLPASAAADDAKLATLVHLQLAEMHFLNGPAELAKAEQVTVTAAKKLTAFTELTADDKRELELRIELVRMRAVFGQALVAYQAGKFPETMAKIAPILAEARKTGAVAKVNAGESPLNTAAKRVDDFRRDRIIALAMQTRIREGAVDQIGDLLDILKKLGGSLSNSAVVLNQMLDGVRPQIDSLRKAGKTAEADALAQGIGKVLDKVAAEPDVKPPTLLVLGRGLRELGNYAKAIEFIKKVPAPADGSILKKRSAEFSEADAVIVDRYRRAQLELARAYRQDKKFVEADAVLKEPLGDKTTPGWANNNDFRREAIYLIEAKAAEADPQVAAKLWGEARNKWSEMAQQYLAPLRKLMAAKNDTKSAFVALLELKALPKHDSLPTKDDEIRKGLADPKPPAWVTELLSEKIKGPDGKLVENPTAIAYIDELKNTAHRMESQVKPFYHDYLFESIRCLTKANIQLTKTNPAALPAKLEALAKQMVALETANPDVNDAVKTRFADLLEEYPQLKEQYLKLGGKALLKPGPGA